jgi:hypothetical protein
MLLFTFFHQSTEREQQGVERGVLLLSYWGGERDKGAGLFSFSALKAIPS